MALHAVRRRDGDASTVWGRGGTDHVNEPFIATVDVLIRTVHAFHPAKV